MSTPAAWPTPCSLPDFPFQNQVCPARVYRVIDGDTLDCLFYHQGHYGKTRLRLAGIDTPEIRLSRMQQKTRRGQKEMAAGEALKQLLEHLLLGREVAICCYQWYSFRGAVVGDLYLDPVNLLEESAACQRQKSSAGKEDHKSWAAFPPPASEEFDSLTAHFLSQEERFSLSRALLEQRWAHCYQGGKKKPWTEEELDRILSVLNF